MRILVLVLVACSSSPALAPPPRQLPPPPAVTLGAPLELADAVALRGGGILARTAAGELVRFGATLHVQTAVGAHATAIAVDGDRAFAGLADGAIEEVDPTTLAPTPLAHVTGQALWLAVRGPELVVFTQPGAAKAYTIEIRRLDTGAARSIAIPNDRSEAMEIAAPATFTRDAKAVWFGIDAGEWGGWVGRVDLATGKVTHVVHEADVYGFLAVGDRMLAHGGTVHMGITDGYIADLAGTASHVLWKAEWTNETQTPPPVPVVRMLVEDDHYLVLLWNELYRVDARFKTWTLVAKLAARVHPGRPDAVGSYPATTAMLKLGDRLVIATTRDGLFELRGDQLVRVD